ncbi:MAG: AAA family ATPase, partial [Actinomycetota bacterium]|nr:AAA family ATPase [Actinomycetota bacterium]
MLEELIVENLGVIERAELGLGEGMTVITGETGAGKTMLVGALQMALGARTDPRLIREGASQAVVEARFVLDGEEFVVSRTLSAQGRSR